MDRQDPPALGEAGAQGFLPLPSRMIALSGLRRWLAAVLFVVLSLFAATNSLRLASLNAADAAMARANRQTAGVVAADQRLDAARAARDRACKAGEGRSVACAGAKDDVAKQERERSAAVGRVEAQAAPEGAAFSRLVAWASRCTIQPSGDDLGLLRVLLPQLEGLLLALARR